MHGVFAGGIGSQRPLKKSSPSKRITRSFVHRDDQGAPRDRESSAWDNAWRASRRRTPRCLLRVSRTPCMEVERVELLLSSSSSSPFFNRERLKIPTARHEPPREKKAGQSPLTRSLCLWGLRHFSSSLLVFGVLVVLARRQEELRHPVVVGRDEHLRDALLDPDSKLFVFHRLRVDASVRGDETRARSFELVGVAA